MGTVPVGSWVSCSALYNELEQEELGLDTFSTRVSYWAILRGTFETEVPLLSVLAHSSQKLKSHFLKYQSGGLEAVHKSSRTLHN